MGEYKLPKDCYSLYSELAEQMEKGIATFDDALPKLLTPGYWVEIDWKNSSSVHKKEIKSTPMLLVSEKEKIITKNFSDFPLDVIAKMVRTGYSVLISARIATNWKYKIKQK